MKPSLMKVLVRVIVVEAFTFVCNLGVTIRIKCYP